MTVTLTEYRRVVAERGSALKALAEARDRLAAHEATTIDDIPSSVPAEYLRPVLDAAMRRIARLAADLNRLTQSTGAGRGWHIARTQLGPCVRCGQNVRRAEAFEHRTDLADMPGAIEHAAVCPDPYVPGDVIHVVGRDGRVAVTVTDPTKGATT